MKIRSVLDKIDNCDKYRNKNERQKTACILFAVKCWIIHINWEILVAPTAHDLSPQNLKKVFSGVSEKPIGMAFPSMVK